MAGKRKPAKRAGRPSRYLVKYGKLLVDWMDRPAMQERSKTSYYKDGSVQSEEPLQWATTLPTFQGFASSIHVSVDTLLEWRDKYPEFRKSYDMAKQLQENIWLQNAMSGLYNPTFAKFFGENCLGYKSRQEIDMDAGVEITLGDAEKYAK